MTPLAGLTTISICYLVSVLFYLHLDTYLVLDKAPFLNFLVHKVYLLPTLTGWKKSCQVFSTEPAKKNVD